MASVVAEWPSLYGCDGIDLDIETGAGDTSTAGTNLVYFVEKLREINPSIIINQPVFGYPVVPAANAVVNSAWGPGSPEVDTIGIMWYVEAQSLNYVPNYSQGSTNNLPVKLGFNKTW